MKFTVILIISLSLFGLFIAPASVHAQTRAIYKVDHQIEQQLHARFNQEFHAHAYNKRDTPKWRYKFGFSDPYGTLKDCYIFLATPYGPAKPGDNRHGFIGIYKSGSIIWTSKREINLSFVVNMEIPGVLDLNRDGKVDIITSWYIGMYGGNVQLWIYEWNGTTGERINQVSRPSAMDEEQSPLQATVASLELIDVQPDGIKEIEGLNLDSTLTVYSWNGQEYGKFGVRLPHPLPRNGVKAELQARVTHSGDHLQFHYRIHIKKSSIQSLEEFAVKNFSHKKPTGIIKPSKWVFSPADYRLVRWQVSPMFEPMLTYVMHPGTTDTLFAFTSTGLPRPGIYYSKGNNGAIKYNTEDMVNNSVQGTTLSPYDPPNPFDAGAFTDTLRSFTTQACKLKWIDNKGLCQSLQAKLKNVQKQLGKGKTNTAINDLQAFINEVEAQKGKHLTSEGYGLLYYNGEYLLKKLEK
jgi:hypothetical protein